MNKIFGMDSPLFNVLNQIVDMILLSILWLIFSLPVVTAGASATALYYTATKVLRHRRGYLFREFWHGFKSNLKQSTVIWLIYMLLMLLMSADIRIFSMYESRLAVALQYILVIIMMMVTAVLIYGLAYTARFQQKIRYILMNSLLMAFRHLPKTLLLLAVTAAALFSVYIFLPALFVAPALAALLASLILESIFVKYMSEADQRKEELRNHPEQYEYMNRAED